MIGWLSSRHALLSDTEGTTLIETAIVAPVLILLSLGAFQVSGIVARQSELQSAVSEAQAIALAAAPDTVDEITTVQQVIMKSARLPAEQVLLSNIYRCGWKDSYVQQKTSCEATDKVSTYVRIQIRDTYTPIWAQYGMGDPLSFNLVRYVLVGQKANA